MKCLRVWLRLWVCGKWGSGPDLLGLTKTNSNVWLVSATDHGVSCDHSFAASEPSQWSRRFGDPTADLESLSSTNPPPFCHEKSTTRLMRGDSLCDVADVMGRCIAQPGFRIAKIANPAMPGSKTSPPGNASSSLYAGALEGGDDRKVFLTMPLRARFKSS